MSTSDEFIEALDEFSVESELEAVVIGDSWFDRLVDVVQQTVALVAIAVALIF